MKAESLRLAYGQALVELGREDDRVVVLEADLGKSTMSILFQEAFPSRYFEMGIAEANMAGTAAGLSLVGKIPFIHSFAVFAAGRAYDQIRQSIAIARLNVKICGSSAGLSDFGDGSTHQSIEDMAIMRALPNMTVLVPVDAVETRKMVRAMVEWDGPVYIRINRNDLPVLTDPDSEFQIGKLQVMRDGSDVAVFANGVMVSKALAAAEELAEEGISVKVINASTVKPLADEEVLAHVEGCRGVVTAEEHSVIGGLGSAVACALRRQRNLPIEFVGVKDSFGKSALSYDELLVHYGLTADAVKDAVKAVLEG
ncbi:MAG TPA: transketolase family protein [Firmicutes bacterium]|nr:transketolase family protein [Bacillota bacterium]